MRYSALPRGHRVADRYLIDEIVGEGRSSAVYRAFDLSTKSYVALKVLDPFLSQDPVSLERFRREVEIIRRLDHPNVVRLFSFFRDDELYVIAMEYVDGVDLGTHIRRFGRLEVEELLVMAKTIAVTVESCHKAKVLHRDLKPQNVLLTADREVKLVDFGVAKISTMSDLTKTGTVVGTPTYMAPEQFTTRIADPRSDVYSLGVLFYELLTERPPYSGLSLPVILQQQQQGEVEPISTFRDDVPEWLEAVVLKCLRTRRRDRYQSCYELLRDLEKGERSLARYEAKRPAELCLSCKAERIAGLPFCHDCGTLMRDVYERGRHALVLYQCDEPAAVGAYLSEVYGIGDPFALRAALDDLPVLILWGVSQRTAAALANDLAVFPCELAVTEKLPQELRLPRRFVVYATLPLLPMYVLFDRITWAVALPFLAASQGVVVALYRRRIRPLMSAEALELRSEGELDPFVVPAANQLRRMRAKDLKALLGKIVSSYLTLRRAQSAAVAGIDPKALAGLMRQAFKAAEAVEAYELYLESRSLNQIKQRLDAAELRLKHAATTEVMEPLIEVMGRLLADFKRYQEVQDLHSRLFVGLLNMNTALRGLADAAVDRRTVPQAAGDLELLERDLEVDDPDLPSPRRAWP